MDFDLYDPSLGGHPDDAAWRAEMLYEPPPPEIELIPDSIDVASASFCEECMNYDVIVSGYGCLQYWAYETDQEPEQAEQVYHHSVSWTDLFEFLLKADFYELKIDVDEFFENIKNEFDVVKDPPKSPSVSDLDLANCEF